ncbi:MAG: 3'-5' exonuclease domain-containing protein 2 [Deltaproteobacteria bacterium]|jgi:ribonuclease D|nr:3'-5' exonuclease domain-containing protein 2 [Deltaproteobacteria bacterium]
MNDDFDSSAPGEDGRKLSRDAINTLPLFHYPGKVKLIRTAEDVARAIARLSGETVLGFDTETRPSFIRGKSYSPSLVQLAGEEEIYLFQLQWQPLSSPLADLLACETVVKAGVAAHEDMHALEKLYPFTPAGVVDLAAVARRHRLQNQSLRALAAFFLGVRVSKGERCSNWGVRELTLRQVRYAATDAWASRAIYLRMREEGLVEEAK